MSEAETENKNKTMQIQSQIFYDNEQDVHFARLEIPDFVSGKSASVDLAFMSEPKEEDISRAVDAIINKEYVIFNLDIKNNGIESESGDGQGDA